MIKVLCVLLLATNVGAIPPINDEECAPDNVDVMDLAEMNIFQTSILENERVPITMDDVRKQLESTASKEMQVIAQAESAFQNDVMAGKASEELVPASKASDSVSSSLAAQELKWFVPVCPYRYYWLNNYRLFYYEQNSRKYCWSYYPIYATSCSNRYCNWWFSNPYTVYFYYRCYPNYRSIGIYARCATLGEDGWVWSSEYIRRYVPRGCSCKRYYNQIWTAKVCPADVEPL